jgi:DNA-repair protein XRCC1
MQEGVVFTISGIQNPERGQLRTKGLEMGGQYRPDWSTDCTVLVCAFVDTPKFNQVKADGGSIVSKVFKSIHMSEGVCLEITSDIPIFL